MTGGEGAGGGAEHLSTCQSKDSLTKLEVEGWAGWKGMGGGGVISIGIVPICKESLGGKEGGGEVKNMGRVGLSNSNIYYSLYSTGHTQKEIFFGHVVV